jgi:hypothetical protein
VTNNIRYVAFSKDSSGTNGIRDGNKPKSRSFKKTLDEDCDSLHENIRVVNNKGIGVKLVMKDTLYHPVRFKSWSIRDPSFR